MAAEINAASIVSSAGCVSGGATYSGSGNINSTGADLQTAGTSRITDTTLSPAGRDNYRKVLEATIHHDSVKVVIADQECGITDNQHVLLDEHASWLRLGVAIVVLSCWAP